MIVLVTLAAYVPAMRGGFIWDDDAYLTENETLTSVEGLGRIWLQLGATPQYYPLVFTTFWIEHRLWGLEPFCYHLANVLLHALSAILLWFVLRKLSIPGAWLAAAVFALHPVHAESVAWITERKNVLSGVFYWSSLLAYLRFTGVGAPNTSPALHWRWYGPAAVLFVCALLSKTVAGSLPAAILLLLWWKRQRLTPRDVLPLMPMFLLAILMATVTIWMERYHVGTKVIDWSLSPLDRCLIAGRALCFYLGKLVWPCKLTFIYPRWWIDASQWWQYVYPLAVLTGVTALWLMRKRIGKAPLVGVLFFAGTLLPALGFIDVFPMRYSFVADHFQYLASAGPIVLLAALAAMAFQRLTDWLCTSYGGRVAPPMVRALGVIAPVLVLAALGTRTWHQGKIYADKETLWRDTVTKNPRAWMARINLGNILSEQGKFDEAMTQFRAVLPANRRDAGTIVLARAHFNLGNTLARQGRIDEAMAEYRTAIRIEPRYHPSYYGVGWALEMQGQLDEAIRQYQTALRLKASYAPARQGLERVLRRNANLSPSKPPNQQQIE